MKGYVANRNRTLEHLYENEIGNNIFLSGDSHQSWVESSLTPNVSTFLLLVSNHSPD